MIELLSILGKQLVFSSLLYVIYVFLFEKENMHYHNRIFLLVSLLLILIVPHVSFDVFPQVIYIEQVQLPTLPEVENITQVVANPIHKTASINYTYLSLLAVFFIGVVYRTWSLMKQFYSIYTIDQDGSQASYRDGLMILRHPDIKHTFSFGRKIYTSLQTIPNEIFEHERVHINHKHTLDNVISDILKIVMWYNPFVYLIHHKLKEVHEYTCDLIASTKSKNTVSYAQFLFSTNQHRNESALYNSFHSQIKNRLIMLKQSKAKSSNLKRALAIPVLGLLFFSFTASSYTVMGNATIGNAKGNTMIQLDTIPFNQNVVIDTLSYYNEETKEGGQFIYRVDPDIIKPAESNKPQYDMGVPFNNSNENYENPEVISTIDTFTYFDASDYSESIKIMQNDLQICQAVRWGNILPAQSQLTKNELITLLGKEIQLVTVSDDCELKFDAFEYNVFIKTSADTWEVIGSSYFKENIDILKSNIDQIQSIAIGDIKIKEKYEYPESNISLPLEYHIHITD